MGIMQIPYDLEFVENRPAVRARTAALPEPMPGWGREQPWREHDAWDSLLRWAHALLRRLDAKR